MEYSLPEIHGLQDREVTVLFKDGCCLDLLIVSTMHLEEGGDIVAQILAVRCNRADHKHFPEGYFINFGVDEIESIAGLGN